MKTLVFTGELLTEESFVVTVPRERNSAEAAVSYLVPEGRRVDPGDILAQFDQSSLIQEQLELETEIGSARILAVQEESELEAELQTLLLDLATARRNLKRTRLYAEIDPSLLAEQEAQQYRFDYQTAQIRFKKLEDAITTHGRSSDSKMELARLELEHSQLRLKSLLSDRSLLTIRAPMEGVAIYGHNPGSGRKIQVGDVLWQGLPLLCLPNLKTFRVRAYVYDADFPHLRENMSAKVVLDAFPDREFSARVGRLPELSRPRDVLQNLKAFQVDLILSETDSSVMKPGMSARVSIQVRREGVLSVPRAAMKTGSAGETTVNCRKDPGNAVPVEPVDASGSWVQVLADLSPGEELMNPGLGTEDALLPEIEWVSVRRQDFVFSISGAGVLEAENSHSFGPPPLRDHWEFKITEMVKEGSLVQAGDMLITFDDTEAIQRLREATAELQKGERENDKTRAALEIKKEEINLEREEARAEVQRTTARLARARQFQSILEVQGTECDAELAVERVQLLEQNLEAVKRNVDVQMRILADNEKLHTDRIRLYRQAIRALMVRAPAAGVVIYKGNTRNQKKQIGSAVYPKEVVMLLPDLRSLFVESRVSEFDAGKLKVGQEVLITLDAFPNRKFKGQVEEIGRVAMRASDSTPLRVVEFKVALDRIDAEKMRPGMAAHLEIVVDRYQDVLTVPLPAIESQPEGSFVWTRDEGPPERRRIELGNTIGAVALILQGLEESDQVASRPVVREE